MENKTEFIGPEQSFTGDNAYHFDCAVVEHRPTYFVCLHKMKRMTEKGDLPEFYAMCEKAIAGKRCVAVQMRDEELLAGKALYFEARQEWVRTKTAVKEVALPSLSGVMIRRDELPSTATRTAPAATPKPPQQTIQNLDFAQVVTELAANPKQEAPAKPPKRPVEPPKAVAAPVAPPATKTAPAPAKAGESLLELARRMKQAKSSITTE